MAQALNSFPYLLLLLLLKIAPTSSKVYTIVAFGAKPDMRTDSAKSFVKAWAAACGEAEPSTVSVPHGRFLLGQATLTGPCKSKITVQIDGELVAPSDPASFGKGGDWLVFNRVDGVSIRGGTIDGRGANLWACKGAGHRCPPGATSLTFSNSNGILISGLTSMNSELYHIVINSCHGVTIQNVKIRAPGDSPNTDGIHVQASTGVTVTGTGIMTGDDCISIGPGTTNLWIENVNCGPGHGISIGSLGKESQEKGVQNVTVKGAVFTGTTNGLRIKTWGRPSDGFVRGAVFEHVSMKNVDNPIIIDQNYCPDDKGCPDQNSGIKISDVKYSDIHGSSTTQVAMNFACSASKPCSGIGLQNIKLTYGNKAATAQCKHVQGNASGYVVPPSCL